MGSVLGDIALSDNLDPCIAGTSRGRPASASLIINNDNRKSLYLVGALVTCRQVDAASVLSDSGCPGVAIRRISRKRIFLAHIATYKGDDHASERRCRTAGYSPILSTTVGASDIAASEFSRLRDWMVDVQLAGRGIAD